MVKAGWVAAVAVVAGCASGAGGVGPDAATLDAGFDVGVDAGFDGGVDAGFDAGVAMPACPLGATDDVPTVDAGPPQVAEFVVSSGSDTRCARMSDGTLRCEGANRFGELGLGTSGDYRTTRSVVPGLAGVEQLAVFVSNLAASFCARLRDGTVRCWGENQFGQLGTGHVGDETCESMYSCRTSPTPVPGLGGVVYLTAGRHGFCAVRCDGAVWCWGAAAPNALVPAGDGLRPARSGVIAGVARLWSTEGGWVAQLSSGGYVLVRSDGAGPEALAIPQEAEMPAFNGQTTGTLCYRLPDASVRCFGDNFVGGLGNGTSSPDGTFVTTPIDPGLVGVRSVAIEGGHGCALLSDHTVSCWGWGLHNSLGAPPPDACPYDPGLSRPCATRPVRVQGLDQVERLVINAYGGCGLRSDRTLWCWGGPTANDTGALERVEW